MAKNMPLVNLVFGFNFRIQKSNKIYFKKFFDEF